MADALYV